MEKLKEHENIVRTIMEHEVTKLIAIISSIFAVVNYIIIPLKLQGKELEIIKTNHLHTIETNMIEVKALNKQDTDANNEQHRLLLEQLIKTATILDQHIINDKN